MSFHKTYELVRQAETYQPTSEYKRDKMAVITALHRIATVSIERIMLMMNNTQMCPIRRFSSIQQVYALLQGKFEEQLPGDTGDFFRRKLADELHVTFAVDGVTHDNIMSVVEGALILEAETRRVLGKSSQSRHTAPTVDIDETILNILARIADVF